MTVAELMMRLADMPPNAPVKTVALVPGGAPEGYKDVATEANIIEVIQQVGDNGEAIVYLKEDI